MTADEGLADYLHAEALDEWLDAEIRMRTRHALACLDALDILAARMHHSDLFDAAHSIWSDFIVNRGWVGRTDPLHDDERDDIALVFARAMKYLTAAEVVEAASSTFGAMEFTSPKRDGYQVSWVPWSETVVLTIPGRVGPSVLVIAEGRVSSVSSPGVAA